MIGDGFRHWLSMKFLQLGHLCLDAAVWVEPQPSEPPRRPPLELEPPPGDGPDDGPQQMEMRWA